MAKSTKKQTPKVEYLEDSHTYLVGGKIVPSATKLVAFATGEDYSQVPPEILKKAQEYGTAIHKAIQDYVESGHIEEEYGHIVFAFTEMQKKYMLNIKDMEQMVVYDHSYCGRYDIMDNDGVLWDIKTSSKLREDALSWQLGLYYLALGVEKDIGYAIWVKKHNKEKLIDVKLIKPKTNKECVELVKMYEQSSAEQ